MKHITFFLSFVICFSHCVAQTVINPLFERTDTPEFHIDKVENKKDSTILYCTYTTQPGSWANISGNTYIEDVYSKQKQVISRCEGLPFSPRKQFFNDGVKLSVILYFPSIANSSFLNLIENENEKSFNIYGIDLKAHPYIKTYNDYDILRSIRQQEFYSQSGNIERAIEYCKSALEGKKYLFGSRSSDVGKSLYILASLCYQAGLFSEAIEYSKEGIAIDTICNLNSEDLVSDYNNLSYIYNAIGDYENAIEMANKSKLLLSEKDTLTESYAAVLTNLSNFNNSLGNYNDALLFARQAIAIREATVGKSSMSYAITMSNMATAVSNLGDYDEAILLNKQCLTVFIENNGESYIDNATILGNLSYNYACLDSYQDAIFYGEKACEVLKKNGIENVSYLTSLSNISLYYFLLACANKETDTNDPLIEDLISKSILFSDSAQNVAKRISEAYLVLPTLYNNQAYILSLQGKFKEAIEAQRKACDLSDKSTLEYPVLLQNLSLCQLFCREYNEALKTAKIAVDIFDSRIRHNLKSLSSYNISMYWNTLDHWYNNFIPKCAFYTRDKDAVSYLYDKTALFAKGFLLNSNSNIRYLLLKENNNTNNTIVNNLNNLYNQLDSISNTINSDSYNNVIADIKKEESLLASQSVAYRTYIDNINCRWQDVQKKLTASDIAIEFLKCPLGLYNDSVMYVALVLKKQYESPLLIPLFNEHELVDSFASMPKEWLYNLIWKPLNKELADVDNIYFSPAGVLYNIGIEYLSCGNNSYMFERYNIYRLSSTRLLVDSIDNKSIHKAALFGGISYDITEENDTIFNDMVVSESLNRKFVSSLKRNGFDALDGTLMEIKDIADVLRKNNVELLTLTNEYGSESNLKKLSGKNIGIIHLATHGSYIDFKSAETNIVNNNFTFILPRNSTDISGESYALTRSFLVMAGGNRLPQRKSIPNHGNDGIITALEISKLDFQSTDLVVLSACQTALGDITNEGIIGLQRGFKKAGANTLLMSLDNVDDGATRILMVEFYKNLMSGKSKHQSLKDAQKYLREVENGKYDDPKYWAAFIMLDGIK